MKASFTPSFKTLLAGLFFLVSLPAFSNGDKTPAGKGDNSVTETAAGFNIQFSNPANKIKSVDSAYVILDKYDRTGAGIVMGTFYVNEKGQMVISGLPAGKYYAEIYTYGITRQHFSTVITVTMGGQKKNKKGPANSLEIAVPYVDTYVPGNAGIPEENTAAFLYASK